MNKYFYTSPLLMFMFCIECGATDLALSNTITREKDPIIFKRVYQTFGESATYMIGGDDPNLLYALAPTSEFVGFYNFSDKSLGSWSLTEAENIAEPIPEYVERKRNLEVPITYDRMADDPTLGCMNNNPLTYGDVEGDGKKELVVFIKNTLQLFSVEHKKVVFSVQLDVDDWHTKEYSKEIISELRGTAESSPRPEALTELYRRCVVTQNYMLVVILWKMQRIFSSGARYTSQIFLKTLSLVLPKSVKPIFITKWLVANTKNKKPSKMLSKVG